MEPLCFTTWRIRHFNSQPHEEADTAMTGIHSGSTYFNSQPHEEADCVRELTLDTSLTISTHSLTKRLTVESPEKIKVTYISTHSLTKRLTPCAPPGAAAAIHISTHSLTKRLTGVASSMCSTILFQLTASRRG